MGRSNEIHATLPVGAAMESVEVRAEPTRIETSTAMLSSALTKQAPEAESKGVVETFEYSVKQNITIAKNQSALVPILQSHIEVEKVALWRQWR